MARADEIVDKVEKKFIDTQKLRQRMDEDYDKRWRLTPFRHEDLEGYKTYTSNESKTTARLAISILSRTMPGIKCPQNNDPRELREQDNAKEQFARGCLKSNDERLVRMGLIPLRRAMSFHLIVRGFTAGRCTLVKNQNRVWADATPWDARDVAWEYGADGLAYICLRYSMLRFTAEREWGLSRTDGSEQQVVTVYDYLDEELSTVIIPDIKDTPVKNEPHGMVDGYGIPRVPGWVVANPLQPPVGANNVIKDGAIDTGQMGDLLADYGESIFAENRETGDTHNYNMSVMKNLVARSLRPVFGIRSRDGVKLVEGDPFEDGAEIPLAEGEELIVYDFLQTAPDMIPYMTVNQGENQRGGFPVIMHGETPAAISGFAMQTLKSGPGDKVLAAAEAEETALKTIINAWSDQYVTGAFGQGMQLSGQGGNRKWFVVNITPDMIRELPALEVTLKPQLPEDDAGKVQRALQLRQPGVDGMPVLGDHNIREDILDREDSDQDMDTILQQMAMTNPLVQAHRLTDALAKRGDEGAQYWHAQWKLLVLQAVQAGVPLEQLIPPESNPGTNPGFSPEVLPNAAQGITRTPGINTPFQAGPLVEPGRERPGAQTNGRARPGVGPIP
ncbi:MAG: hypothetical protein ACE5Q6_08350 [Dehalococcoidia bacterium]